MTHSIYLLPNIYITLVLYNNNISADMFRIKYKFRNDMLNRTAGPKSQLLLHTSLPSRQPDRHTGRTLVELQRCLSHTSPTINSSSQSTELALTLYSFTTRVLGFGQVKSQFRRQTLIQVYSAKNFTMLIA